MELAGNTRVRSKQRERNIRGRTLAAKEDTHIARTRVPLNVKTKRSARELAETQGWHFGGVTAMSNGCLELSTPNAERERKVITMYVLVCGRGANGKLKAVTDDCGVSTGVSAAC